MPPKRILGVCWADRVPCGEIYDRTYMPSIAMFLLLKHLCWVGHVTRMPAHHLPRQILFGQLLHDHRSAGGQTERFKDNFKTLLKKCNMKSLATESLAADHVVWTLPATRVSPTERRAQRRAQTHQHAAGLPPSGAASLCPSCDKICGYALACTAT